MVDINLFKEDEEDKEWKPTLDDENVLEGELTKDLDFGDDIHEPPDLNKDMLLDDEEEIPDFKETDENELEEDYEYGEIREKKPPVLLWLFLGVVVIGVALYLFLIRSGRLSKSDIVNLISKRPAVSDSLSSKQVSKEPSVGTEGQQTDSQTQIAQGRPISERVTTMMNEGSLQVKASVGTLVDASKIIVQDLSRYGQFGAMLISGDRFFVEYVSETPGVTKSMGHRIQTLLNASGHTVSPEERHRTAGRIHYYGVVSGGLPKKSGFVIQPGTGRYTSVDQFVSGVNTLSLQNRMVIQETQKFSDRSDRELKQAFVRMKMEGSKENALAFMESLKNLQGSFGLAKVLIVPANYSDFTAGQVKVVIECSVFIL